MLKKIYVINGYSSSGKDEFVNIYDNCVQEEVINLSSVQPVKILLEPICGACRAEDDRMLISNIKDYLDDSMMYTLRYLSDYIDSLIQASKDIETVLFIHIREENIITMLGGLYPIKTILVNNSGVTPSSDKESDIGKLITYDYEVDNTIQSKENLYLIATDFIKREDNVS